MHFDTLRGRGEVIPDVLLSHIVPLRWEQVNITGDYVREGQPRLDPDGLRPLGSSSADHHTGVDEPRNSRPASVDPLIPPAATRCLPAHRRGGQTPEGDEQLPRHSHDQGFARRRGVRGPSPVPSRQRAVWPSSWPGPSGEWPTKLSPRPPTGIEGSRPCSRNCRITSAAVVIRSMNHSLRRSPLFIPKQVHVCVASTAAKRKS